MRSRSRFVVVVTSIFAAAAVVALTICSNFKAIPHNHKLNNSMDTIVTALTVTSGEQFAESLRNNRLILHVDVDWAMQAIESRSVIVKFRGTIESDPQVKGIVFRRIDITKQGGEVWESALEWLKHEKADVSVMFGGYGAVLWVRSGKIVGTVHYAADEGVDKLVLKTYELMASE